jgi:hypothetical protein
VKFALPIALTLGLAFAAGCGSGAGAQPDVSPRALIVTGEATPSVNWVQLLRRMNRAPLTVPHSGVRRVEQYWTVEDRPKQLSYREAVASDGTGRFSVQALAVLNPPMSMGEEAVFVALQNARAGFVQRYRDFAVRDVDAFVRNYSIVDTGALVTVAGRDCSEFLVQRTTGHSVRYWIAVDRETSLVLRTRHETAAGVLLGVVEFETLDLAPNFATNSSTVAWHQPVTEEVPLSSDPGQALAQLGFQPRLPDGDNAEFVLQSATVVTAPDPRGGPPRVWAKHALTDGAEIVFLLHGGADPAPGADDVVVVAPSVGPWNTAEGSLHGELFTAMGRVSVDTLLDLLTSTL